MTARILRVDPAPARVIRVEEPTPTEIIRVGLAGPPGPLAAPQTVVAGAPVTHGMPLYISRLSGQGLPARADGYLTAMVAGLAGESVASGFPVSLIRGSLTLDDWTAFAGTPELTPGRWYFLTATGGLSITPPSAPAAVALARIGLALSPTTLDVQPTPPRLR